MGMENESVNVFFLTVIADPAPHTSSVPAAFAGQTVCGGTGSSGGPDSGLWLNRENPGAQTTSSASHRDTPLSNLFSKNNQMMGFFLTNPPEALRVQALFLLPDPC